jgi:hypothetical protein
VLVKAWKVFFLLEGLVRCGWIPRDVVSRALLEGPARSGWLTSMNTALLERLARSGWLTSMNTALLERLVRSGWLTSMNTALLKGLARRGWLKVGTIMALLEGFARRLKTLCRCYSNELLTLWM